MSTYQERRSIADKLNVDYAEQGVVSPLRRWRQWSFLLGIVAPVLLFGVYWFGSQLISKDKRPPRTVFWAGNLSDAHSADKELNNNCQECHSQKGAAFKRMFSLSNAHHSVDDKDCRQCHSERTDDHSAFMMKDDLQGCVTCHIEHQGNQTLSAIGHALCAECHQDLETSRPEGSHFVDSIQSFETHPEFAIVRLTRGDGEPMPGADHGVFDRVEKNGDKWEDGAHLRFNHAAHLHPDGVPNHPGADSDRKTFNCTDCHVEKNGEYRTVVTYQTCKDCHPIRVTSHAAFLDDYDRPLRHDPLMEVGKEIRDRLATFYVDHPTGDTNDTGRRPRPGAPRKEKLDAPTIEAAIAEESEKIAKRFLGESPETENWGLVGCAFCHTFEGPKSEDADIFDREVHPPSLPERWLPHGRFDHRAHGAYSCISCHEATMEDRSDVLRENDAAASPTLLKSDNSNDVLIPGVKICQKCHTTGTQGGDWGSAKGDCIECHSYHRVSRDSAANLIAPN